MFFQINGASWSTYDMPEIVEREKGV